MPGAQLGYPDSMESSLIIVLSDWHVKLSISIAPQMKNIQNYARDFFRPTCSAFSVIYVNIDRIASANLEFTFGFSLFLIPVSKYITKFYLYSIQTTSKIWLFLCCHYCISDHHPFSLDYYCNIPTNLCSLADL